ncbi:MAG TPA: PQQ-binding-like beta-propeller repeat protein [Blastocatellia bacterium]|nr:PQQ-binding-like beta-propeller repeat protein [Blastocatellia bacterium]
MRIATLIITALLCAHGINAQAQSAKPSPVQSKQPKAAPNQNQIAEPGAVSTSRLALPFKRAWQHLTDEATTLPPTLDGERIYLPLTGGRVFCLDRDTGALLWSAEPGGLVSSPVAASDNVVYIATRKLAADGSEAGASLRVVDKATGLTVWLKDYPRAFTSPLTVGAGRLYVGAADGAFYALDARNGDTVWKVATQDVVRGQARVVADAVAFGSDDGALRVIEAQTCKLVWKLQTGGRIAGQPAADERLLYVGSGDGYVYAVDQATGKLRWRSRTGAAIEAPPVIVGDRVLVASFDNFIYALSRATGDRLWKRRLENRITTAPLVEGDAAMVAPFRSDYVAVFLNANGRRVNLYQLDKEYEIVAAPLFAGDTLILATSKGLVVATAARPEHPANAIKK